MSLLHRLRPEGGRLATPELASGATPRWPPDASRELVEPVERQVELERLDEALDGVLARSQPHQASLDVELAPLVHQHLPLSRREAGDPGVWRWLAIVHRPDVVRHRWENVSWASMRARFLAPGTRPDSNAFSRWWWIAELSRDGEDYSLTRAVLRRQPLATAIFVRGLSYYRPAVAACAAALEELEAQVIERVMLDVSKLLATVPLEALDEPALRRELAAIVARVEASAPR